MQLTEKAQQLVLNNQRLVYYLARKLNVSQSDFDDIVSIGMFGLIKAAQTFDNSKGAKFATYASRCIYNEIFMSFRKGKNENLISLDEVINDDGDGGELTLSDVLSTGEDFTEKFLINSECSRAISIILNCLTSKERLLMLYKIAGVTQIEIANSLNFSQSYISRLEKRLSQKMKSLFSTTEQYKEVFSMSITGDSYKISFSSKDVPHFNKIFSLLLQNLTSTEALPDFVVNCNNQRIIIQIPAHSESFSFIAQIIKEIDDYSIKYTSVQTSADTNCGSLPKVKSNFTGKNVIATEQQNLNQALDNSDVNSEDVLDEPETPEENKSDVIYKNSDTTEAAIKISQITQDSQTNEPKSKKGDISKKIREYIFSLDSFTLVELARNFPDLKYYTITSVLNSEKKKGLITSAGRGKFVVNKAKLLEITQNSNTAEAAKKSEMSSSSQEAQTNKAKAEKGDISKKIRDHIFSLDSFTTKELTQKFPDLKYGTIAWILNSEKKKGLIASAGPGKYVVNKTENT